MLWMCDDCNWVGFVTEIAHDESGAVCPRCKVGGVGLLSTQTVDVQHHIKIMLAYDFIVKRKAFQEALLNVNRTAPGQPRIDAVLALDLRQRDVEDADRRFVAAFGELGE
jgi:hypothetical protein